MKAWRIHGVADLRLDDVPMPVLKSGWVLVKVRVVQPSLFQEVAQINDSQFLSRWWGVPGEKLIKKLAQPGHEFCGDVVDIKGDVKLLKVGDKVSAPGLVPCGQCTMCLSGREALCPQMDMFGLTYPGAFAEYVAAPEKFFVRMPSEISYSEAAAVQPLCSSAAYVEAAQIRRGESVVVLGQGVVGLACTQLARVSGAGMIIGVDIRDEALALSRKLGANTVIDARKKDPVKTIRDLTGDVGVDIVFEAAGGKPEQELSGARTFFQAIDIVRRSGRIVQCGALPAGEKIEPGIFVQRNINYLCPSSGLPKAMGYLAFLIASRRMQVAPTITHTLQGIDKIPEALEITSHKSKYKGVNSAQVAIS